MIILIGGMGYTGKTLLAQRLLEKHKVPYLSLDHLKMGLYRGLKEEKYSPVQDYWILGKALWPIVKGIIMTNIENRQNLVVEGCYILPHLAKDFEAEYKKEIMAVFMGFSPEYIKENYNNSINKYSGVIEKREETSDESIKIYINQTKMLKAECEKRGQIYFEIKADYLKETGEIIEYIGQAINMTQ